MYIITIYSLFSPVSDITLCTALVDHPSLSLDSGGRDETMQTMGWAGPWWSLVHCPLYRPVVTVHWCGPHSHTLIRLMGYSDTQTTPDTNSVSALDVCYHSCVECFSVFAPETEIAANLLSPEQHRAPAARNWGMGGGEEQDVTQM